MLTGFGTTNPNAVPNSLRWGLDHRIHGMPSQAGGQLQPLQWAAHEAEQQAKRDGKPSSTEPEKELAVRAISARGRDFSIDPYTGQLQLESGGSQFGMAFDAWGRKFESSNSAQSRW